MLVHREKCLWEEELKQKREEKWNGPPRVFEVSCNISTARTRRFLKVYFVQVAALRSLNNSPAVPVKSTVARFQLCTESKQMKEIKLLL